VRKITFPIIVGFIVAALYIISCEEDAAVEKGASYGDVAGIGTDEDPDARLEYEIKMLRDPATGRIPAHMRSREMAFAANLPNDRDLPAARTTAVGWDARGPWNVGGRTRALAIDVTNNNIIIAGSTSGGMWRSTDGGKSWKPTTPANLYKSVSCVVQDTRPGHTNVWYFGTGEAYGTSASGDGAFYYGNGIYKSTDSGKNWSLLPATASSLTSLDAWGDIIWNIAIDPSDMVNDVVYAASYGAVYRSANGGTSWTPVVGSFSTSYFTDLAVTSAGVVYATFSSYVTYGGIFRSTDGVTYTKITPPGFPTSYNRIKIGICPDDENQVYFLGNTPSFGLKHTSYSGQVEWNSLWKYNYISGDGTGAGAAWRDFSLNLPNSGGPFDKYMCQGSYDITVKVKPGDSNAVFIGGTNLYRSTSGFSDSTHTTFIGGYAHGAGLPVVGMFLNHHPDQHDVIFYPGDPNKMLSANDGGIFYTNDNTVPDILWTSLNNGYLTSMFYTCAIDHATDNDIVIAGAQDNGSWFTNSADVKKPWVTPRGGDGSFCAIADYGKAYYFSIQNGKIMKAALTTSGKVDSFARVDPRGAKGYLFINPFVLDPNNNNLMYMAGGKFLWRNNDLSGIPYRNNWDSISTNWTKFPDSITSAGTITAVAVSRKPANRVYYGTDTKRVIRIDSANVGTPAMKSITATIFPNGATVSSIAVDPENADHVMVTFSNYGVNSIFYTIDGGTTWKRAGGNLEQNNMNGTGNGPSVRWGSIIPVPDGRVYLVGTSVGLFATTTLNDTFTVWTQQGTTTIGAAVVDMIDHRNTDGLVVVATHSNGIFSSHITSVANMTVVKEVRKANEVLKFTNYPNPFSGETTISFTLNERSNVLLNIYDGAGRLVRVVANEQMGAGEYSYLFATNNLPAGIYYCKLMAGSRSETRKIEIR
jgi:photosystem II stability/assembly factor-like uncharacterized protein